jgi:energy-coupling factor transporter ATP-binding protein EcfA2
MPNKNVIELEKYLAQIDNTVVEEGETVDPIANDEALIVKHLIKNGDCKGFLYVDGEEITHLRNIGVAATTFYKKHCNELLAATTAEKVAKAIGFAPVGIVGKTVYAPDKPPLFEDGDIWCLNNFSPYTIIQHRNAETRKSYNDWFRGATKYWTGIDIKYKGDWDQNRTVKQFYMILAKIYQCRDLQQFPHRVAVMMIGPQGSGKSTLMEIMSWLMNGNVREENLTYLLSTLGGEAITKSLITYVDQFSTRTMSRSDRDIMVHNGLASLIGSKTKLVKAATWGVETIHSPVWAAIFLLTANEIPTSFPKGDNRFLVLDSYQAIKEDEAQKFWQQFHEDNCGNKDEKLRRFAHFLQRIKVSDKVLNTAIETDTKRHLTKSN